MRTFILALGILFLSLFAVVHAGCDKPVKFAGLNWESGNFITAVLSIITEEGYGCKTESVPGASTALDNALAQNDIQVIAEVWSGRSPVMQQAIDSGKVKILGDILKGGATQGWYIPDYIRKKYPELRSYRDLPRFADLFKQSANAPKARFFNCPTGWACETFNTRLLKNTGLLSLFENIHPGVGAALDAEISSAYEQKKPILFYYWQPTGLMAKYHFYPLSFPEHDKNCWKDLLLADGQDTCVSGFPVSLLSIAVSAPFLEAHPDIADFFKKIQFSPEQLNRAILQMQENGRSGTAQARLFLQNHPGLLRQWLPEKMANRLITTLNTTVEKQHFFPQWSLEKSLNDLLNRVVKQQGERLRHFSVLILDYLLLPLEYTLTAIPAWLLIIATGVIARHATRRWIFSLFSMAGLFVIGAFGLWAGLLQTVSLLTVSVFLTVISGIPVGILVAGRQRLYRALLPVLDIMQTMPSFVYLIPVLMLFGLGKVPALFATLIYAIAPLIRLTALGIRHVPQTMTDAGLSLGMTRLQLLRYVVLPLAKPSIMAGINQTVMMSLSMVVLASMIGAPGLGEEVLQAIQTLNVGQGIQAGGSIVLLAIIIDRITQAYGRSPNQRL